MSGLVIEGLSLQTIIPIFHLFPCGIVFSMIDSPNIAKTMTLMSMLSLQSTVRPHVASLVTPPPSRSLGLVTLEMCAELEESLWLTSLIHEQSEGRLGPAADRSDVP